MSLGMRLRKAESVGFRQTGSGKLKSAEPSPSPRHVPQVVARGLARVLVFEDDVRFQSNFRGRLKQLMEEVEAQKLPWDLM